MTDITITVRADGSVTSDAPHPDPELVVFSGDVPALILADDDVQLLAGAIEVRILELEGYSEDTSARRVRLQKMFTALTGDETTVCR